MAAAPGNAEKDNHRKHRNARNGGPEWSSSLTMAALWKKGCMGARAAGPGRSAWRHGAGRLDGVGRARGSEAWADQAGGSPPAHQAVGRRAHDHELEMGHGGQ